MYGIQNGSNTIWLQLNAITLYLLPLLNDTPVTAKVVLGSSGLKVDHNKRLML